ncbi:cysteine proteinase [Aspergillus heteromorphus CBS 117.55]|uniref:Cysteine proteinase n=1 Tax=Aspergillus heteromorphus CBS 117.55 TaxID=1448321 RepID=A0A317WRV1_9EURO|nr:cysteine proteinase [Aspergillus heteromorphus CBS 117.55]PWY87638.1 cysteine proteinase [Aspergillus heteromorphus CBS 117.55]
MSTTYTPHQLELYLERIRYAGSSTSTSTSTRLQRLRQAIEEDPLAALAELQRRQISCIPWGNSALHYSPHRTISLQPGSVFEKLVVRALDGYCMENNNLLYHVLRALGYTVYPTGGRVCLAASGAGDPAMEALYTGLSHMILIVMVNGAKFAVDVGFGNNGPTSPLPLKPDVVSICMAPTEMRLVYDAIPPFVDQTQKVWIYQIRYTPDSRWIPMYSFLGNEFLPQDFEVMSFATSQQRTSWFTQSLVCTRMFLDETESAVQGLYVLAGKEVKRRQLGQSDVVATLQSEEDRVRALAEWFGLHLQEHEVQGIRGLVSEIK